MSLLRSHLTSENHVALLDEARHRSKRELEALIARLAPKPDAPTIVRRVPAGKPQAADASPGGRRSDGEPSLQTAQWEVSMPGLGVASQDCRDCGPAEGMLPGVRERARAESTAGPHHLNRADAPSLDPAGTLPAAPSCVRSRPIVTALSPARYKVQLTIGAETHDKLRRVQDLLRHVVLDGDLEAVFDRAIALLLADLERTRLAAAVRPRASADANARTRHIPAAVKRAVWKRDEGRCGYVGTHGRCRETSLLQFHHVVPFAAGGQATVEGLSLRCARHNTHEAELFFGPQVGVHAGARSPGEVESHSSP